MSRTEVLRRALECVYSGATEREAEALADALEELGYAVIERCSARVEGRFERCQLLVGHCGDHRHAYRADVWTWNDAESEAS